MKLLPNNILLYSKDKEISIEDIRKKLLFWLLILLNVLALPALIIGIATSLTYGQIEIAISQFIIFAPIIFAMIFQKKLSYRTSVYIILCCAYIIAILNTIMYSFGGASLSIMFSVSILATMLLGYKSGFIVMFSFTLPMGIIAYLMINGHLLIQADLQQAAIDPLSWFSAVSTNLFLGTIMVFSYAVIQHNLLHSIGIIHTQTNDLEKNNEQLKQDIKYRIQVQKELEIAKEKAEESDNLKTEFLSNMSHEVRTPMNSIVGFSDLLKTPDISIESCKIYSETISNNANKLMEIMNDIIYFSQLRANQVKINMEDVNIIALCQKLNELFSIQAQEKSLDFKLTSSLSDKETIIFTDEEKLYKTINIILDNAIKFTEKGNIELGCLKNDNNMQIYIKDTGIGISLSNQETIFNSFTQEKKGISRPVEGLGLGLPIAKETIELLNGSLTLESVQGEGSCFYINLPYYDNI